MFDPRPLCCSSLTTAVEGTKDTNIVDSESPYRGTNHYASKTLNEAQRNYTTTENELLVVVYALEKFRAYLVGSNIIIFTNHSSLKYLLTKQNSKARLIRWVLLL